MCWIVFGWFKLSFREASHSVDMVDCMFERPLLMCLILGHLYHVMDLYVPHYSPLPSLVLNIRRSTSGSHEPEILLSHTHYLLLF